MAAPLCLGTYALGLRAADRDQTGTQSLESTSYSLASATVQERMPPANVTDSPMGKEHIPGSSSTGNIHSPDSSHGGQTSRK